MADKKVKRKPQHSNAPAAGGADGPPGGATGGDPATLETVSDKVKLAIIAGLTLAIAVAVVVFAVIGGDDEDGAAALSEVSEISTDLGAKPTPAIPDENPPEELVIDDVVEGDGKEAESGDQLTVQYVGVTYENGMQFDASWDNGQPFPFELGAGGVIPGWDEGVEGMKVGGRRQLTIPPEMAYGAQGQPPDIPPEATLVFVIDLLEVS